MNNQDYFPQSTHIKNEISTKGAKKVRQEYQTEDLLKMLNDIFQIEYKNYLNNDDFFPGCPFNVYFQTYEERLNKFKGTYPDADEFDFLKKQDDMIVILMQLHNKNEHNFYNFYPHLCEDPHRLNFNLSI